MRRATPRVILCCGAALAITGVVQSQSTPPASTGQSSALPAQAEPPGAQNAAANATAQRERAAMAAFGRGDASWATSGADAQRSSWVRTDPKISKEGVQKPEFKYLWKLKLTDNPSHPNSLTPAVILNRYIGYRGFRDLAFVENNGTAIYGIDDDLGRIEWTVHDPQAQQASACAVGTVAGVARPVLAAFPSPSVGFGFGRGGPAHSGVGEPEAGAVTLAEAGRYGFRPPPVATPAQPAAAGAGTNPPPVPPAAASPSGAPVPPARGDANAPGVPGSGGPAPRPPRPPIEAQVLTADGMLHTMYVSNGQEPKPAVPFIPANMSARGFIVVDDVAYAATVACGGGASSVVSLDLKSGATAKWDAPSEIAGTDGPAFGPDRTVYVSTVGGELFALDPKTLEVKDQLKSNQPFASSPVIFQYRQRVLGVAATNAGALVLFDTKSLGGEDHQTPISKTNPEAGQQSTSITLASWMDTGARRWILLPAKNSGKGAIAAWQVKDENGTLSLIPGWTSREIVSPSVPMIINGVVFAASNADPADTKNARRSPSVIYALDGTTGKELWNSGKAMTSSAHNGRLSGGGSQIYLGADDGMLYAFGAWIERQVSP
ncbi:MAG TPA: hypothetical protein VFA65_17435 [Bryobacteraceae bacterium]|nr:hypothetical protein [Bryobacteraceae bacterium]